MRKYLNHTYFISLLLVSAILFTSFPVRASSTTLSSHDQTIEKFINDIELLQNQVFTLAQAAFQKPPEYKSTAKDDIKRINTRIQSLNKEILSYLSKYPSISSENSDILLVQNALNLVKNSLYQIDLLTDASSSIEQFLILQEFFRLRVNAAETLAGLKNLITY